MNNRKEPRSLESWLSYLEQIHGKVIDLGLDRIRNVAASMNVLKPAPVTILVGGTNGKGSTVAMLEAIFQAANFKTATYTSPHIEDYRERVCVNGKWMSEQDHCRAFESVEEARGETSLTYFEFGTLAALELIHQQKVDVAILEIGLGGRLDAVNIVEPDISIVTSVGVDHIDFLGDDRNQIGFEKAGIFRADKPAICGDLNPPVLLVEHANKINAKLWCAEKDFAKIETQIGSWSLKAGGRWVARDLPKPNLPLDNAASALMAIDQCELEVDEYAIRQGLQAARVVGRLETIRQTPKVILDVGHNPHAAKYLATQIQKLADHSRVLVVCGMLKDKDIRGTLAELEGVASRWYLGTLPGPRGASAKEISTVLNQGHQQQQFSSISDAYRTAMSEANENDVVLCFGSFLTVSEIYKVEGKIICG